MFCFSCGEVIDSKHKFCSHCGERITTRSGDDFADDQQKPAAKKPISYEEFLCLRGAKEVERREGFVPKKKKKNLTKIVTIPVGLMSKTGVFYRPARGSIVMVTVNSNSSADGILNASIQKMKLCNALFPKVEYLLTYPDGTPVINIPGTQTEFTLVEYNRFLAKPFQKTTLYLRPKCDDEKEIQVVDSSDDDFVMNEPKYKRKKPLCTTLACTESPTCSVDNTNLDSSDDPLPSLDELFNQVHETQTHNSNDNASTPNLSHQMSAATPLVNVVTSPVPCTSTSTINLDASIDVVEHSDHQVLQSCINDEPQSEEFVSSQIEMSATHEDTLPDVIKRLSNALDRNGRKNIVNVVREDVLDGAYRALQRPQFDPFRLLSVRFAGEDGVDSGGLTREFLRLAMQAIHSSALFHGEENGKFVRLDYSALERKEYKYCGQLMALAVVHNVTMPNFLNRKMFQVLVHGCDNVTVDIDDVCSVDPQCGVLLMKVVSAKDEEEYSMAVAQVEDIAELAGCLYLLNHINRKADLVKAVSHFLVIARPSIAIEQMKTGLATLGVLQAIINKPDVLEEAFVYSAIPLDATSVDNLFSVSFSEKGGNKYTLEKKAHSHWLDFLQDAEGECQLERLLSFTTGLDRVPPLGFDPQITLSFLHDGGQFPVANTCANILNIPLLPDYGTFYQHMCAAITMCSTFTKE